MSYNICGITRKTYESKIVHNYFFFLNFLRKGKNTNGLYLCSRITALLYSLDSLCVCYACACVGVYTHISVYMGTCVLCLHVPVCSYSSVCTYLCCARAWVSVHAVHTHAHPCVFAGPLASWLQTELGPR